MIAHTLRDSVGGYWEEIDPFPDFSVYTLKNKQTTCEINFKCVSTASVYLSGF